MNYNEYSQHDALGLANLVKTKQVTPAELLALANQRACAVSHKVDGIVRHYPQLAQTTLQQPFDPNAPFAGVPFLVKDLIQEIQGYPSAGGCKALESYPSEFTNDVVKRWQQAGLVIFAATKTSQLGARGVTEPEGYTPARNPWDTLRSPGGSSGGSAACVAAGIVPMAGANDGGGSIRIPAAACGLFGLKTGRGLIPCGPNEAESMFGAVSQGVVSRSVRDSAAMLDVLQGSEAHGPYYAPKADPSYLASLNHAPHSLRIGFTTHSPTGCSVDAEAIASVLDAATLLSSLGHEVTEVPLPFDGMGLAKDWFTMWTSMMAKTADTIAAKYDLSMRVFEPDMQTMIGAGRSMSAMDLIHSLDRWNVYNKQMTDYFSQYDLWLSPCINGAAPTIGQLNTPKLLQTLSKTAAQVGLSNLVRKTPQFEQALLTNLAWTPYTQMSNVTGRPSMSVPLYWTKHNLPVGVQFVAPLNGERLLLQLAAQLEQARPWFNPNYAIESGSSKL